MKLTLQITDREIKTEHEGGRPKLTLEHQFNIVKYPFKDKDTGEVRWMGRTNLHQLEEALGFDPLFVSASGEQVEPYITRNGNKTAPRGVDGVARKLNPEFVSAYFDSDGHPSLEWAGKIVYAHIGIRKDEQYGDKNIIKRFKKAPVTV